MAEFILACVLAVPMAYIGAHLIIHLGHWRTYQDLITAEVVCLAILVAVWLYLALDVYHGITG